MKNTIQPKKLFIVILSISVASILFAGLGCEKESKFETLPEIIMEEGEGTVTIEEGVEEEQGEEVSEKIAPNIAEITPPNRSSMSKTQEIVIDFTNSMGPDACVLGGTMAGKSDGGIWSDRKAQNDTLTISPQSSWEIGTGTLKISCTDEDGIALPTSELTYGIQTVYVRQNEDGVGTLDSAMGDINKAIAHADKTWGAPSQVHVANGLYQVKSGSTHVVLKEGVSLYGGFLGSNWKARDPSAYVTLIEDINASDSDLSMDNAAVFAGEGITNKTVIDGFFIKGGGSVNSAAIRVTNGAAPVISNNNLDGGKGKSTSAGVRNEKGSPKIIKNTIFGGDGAFIGTGIANFDHSSPSIYNNVIRGGGGEGKYGCGISNSAASSPEIINNTITGGKGKIQDIAILNGKSIHPKIINNIIFASGYDKGYCTSDGIDSSPSELANNVFVYCTCKYQGDLFASTEINSKIPNAHDNINANPVFVDKAGGDWHLKGTTPESIKAGGQNLEELFRDDRDGNIRTVPWSMGAYQWKGVKLKTEEPLKKKKMYLPTD